jgi:hypothetical protein
VENAYDMVPDQNASVDKQPPLRGPITGGCYCGRVRFRAALEPRSRTNCHCANCRRAVGAQAVAWITVERSDFVYETGTPKRYRADTGAWRTFCDNCGTSLTYEHDARPEEIDVTTGSLDHPEHFAPTKDFFAEERLAWVGLIASDQPRGARD